MSPKKRPPLKNPAAKPAAPTKAPTKGKGIRLTSRLVDDLQKARTIVLKRETKISQSDWFLNHGRVLLISPGWEPMMMQLIIDEWISTLG